MPEEENLRCYWRGGGGNASQGGLMKCYKPQTAEKTTAVLFYVLQSLSGLRSLTISSQFPCLTRREAVHAKTVIRSFPSSWVIALLQDLFLLTGWVFFCHTRRNHRCVCTVRTTTPWADFPKGPSLRSGTNSSETIQHRNPPFRLQRSR